MQLYNTWSQRVERFRPRPGQPVGVYVCGITPYDTTHLGHAFTYVVFDVLIRHLETVHRWPVRYVQNLTDIDDDVLRRSAETGEDWRALGQRWTDQFRADMETLNVRPPDAYPGATAFIPAMQAQIRRLLEAGRAYCRQGTVYYRVASEPEFGALARLSGPEMLATANERGNDPDDPNKEDPLDFVLWQAGKPAEPAWRSPWGPGRPGWHIECSTMAGELLGAPVDIHGGGGDLAFPHHACEIAQCEPLSDVRPWVRIWMHVAMVRKDGEKMSKSLGNLVLVRDLLGRHPADTIRLYLLRYHYRQAWEWSVETFEATAEWTRTLHAAAARRSGAGGALDPAPYGPRIAAALDDDLQTPRAVDALLDLADAILGAPQAADVAAAQDVLRAAGGTVLGLWLQAASPDERRRWPEPQVADPDIAALP
jgi:L-cysteine:1D-myo-inositol 2-amino-2-deoxy-alpha-D-glucopyranoside ligase